MAEVQEAMEWEQNAPKNCEKSRGCYHGLRLSLTPKLERKVTGLLVMWRTTKAAGIAGVSGKG